MIPVNYIKFGNIFGNNNQDITVFRYMPARAALSNDGRSTRITYGFRGQIQFVLTCSSSSRITIIRITVVRRTTRVLSSRQALRTCPSRSPARVYSVFVKIGRPPGARAAFEIPRGSTHACDNLDGFFLSCLTVTTARGGEHIGQANADPRRSRICTTEHETRLVTIEIIAFFFSRALFLRKKDILAVHIETHIFDLIIEKQTF